MRPRFVVPAYNSASTIADCLRALVRQRQDFPDAPITVVVNGATDETAKLARQFAVDVIETQIPNRSRARNLGWRATDSDWCFFIDADVIVQPGWARTLLADCDKPGCAGGQGPIVPVGAPGALTDFRFRYNAIPTKGTHNRLHVISSLAPTVNTAACLFRVEALAEVGGFDETLVRLEDGDLARALATRGWAFAASPHANAEVFWHGEGWPSYLLRFFEVGRSKNAFASKWVFPERAMSSWRFSLRQARSIAGLYLRALRSLSSFHLIRALIETISELGRLSTLHLYQPRTGAYVPGPSKLTLRSGEFELAHGVSVVGMGDTVRLIDLSRLRIAQLQGAPARAFLREIGWETGAASDPLPSDLVGMGYLRRRKDAQ